MLDVNAVKLAARRANIKRYRRLLQTHLASHEREYLLRRLEEEQVALSDLSDTWPIPPSYCIRGSAPVAQPAM
jgi:crotonobetainyl-CoA:carnitine CoA-transferase CaiB-like acyl-CoA transferase